MPRFKLKLALMGSYPGLPSQRILTNPNRGCGLEGVLIAQSLAHDDVPLGLESSQPKRKLYTAFPKFSRIQEPFVPPLAERGQRAGAMTETVFDGGGQLPEGTVVTVGLKQGIVAEATTALFLIGDAAFDG